MSLLLLPLFLLMELPSPPLKPSRDLLTPPWQPGKSPSGGEFILATAGGTHLSSSAEFFMRSTESFEKSPSRYVREDNARRIFSFSTAAPR